MRKDPFQRLFKIDSYLLLLYWWLDRSDARKVSQRLLVVGR